MKLFSKTWAFLTAVVLTAGCCSGAVVSAEESAAVPGDVDGDGYLTGHDAALLSRSLMEEDFSLTAEELSRADINGDGTIDAADVEQMYDQQEYMLGDVDLDGRLTTIDAYCLLTSIPLSCSDWREFPNDLQIHIADTNADRIKSFSDFFGILEIVARTGAQFEKEYLFSDTSGCYYVPDPYRNNSASPGDLDMDGIITDHDVVLAKNGVPDNLFSANAEEWMSHFLGLGDIDMDNTISNSDINWIRERSQREIGQLSDASVCPAYCALQIHAAEKAGYEIQVCKDAVEGVVDFTPGNRGMLKVGKKDYLLLDADGSGNVDTKDAMLLLMKNASLGAGYSYDEYFQTYLLA